MFFNKFILLVGFDEVLYVTYHFKVCITGKDRANLLVIPFVIDIQGSGQLAVFVVAVALVKPAK